MQEVKPRAPLKGVEVLFYYYYYYFIFRERGREGEREG